MLKNWPVAFLQGGTPTFEASQSEKEKLTNIAIADTPQKPRALLLWKVKQAA